MKNEGSIAPAFDLMDLNGTAYKLSELKGQKVYLKFWASWCPICLSGLNEVDKLSADEGSFKVLTVVSPGYGGEKDSKSFKEWFQGLDTHDMIVLLDENGDIARTYGIRAYPTSVYIGTDGVLVKTQPGHVDNEGVKKAMEGIY